MINLSRQLCSDGWVACAQTSNINCGSETTVAFARTKECHNLYWGEDGFDFLSRVSPASVLSLSAVTIQTRETLSSSRLLSPHASDLEELTAMSFTRKRKTVFCLSFEKSIYTLWSVQYLLTKALHHGHFEQDFIWWAAVIFKHLQFGLSTCTLSYLRLKNICSAYILGQNNWFYSLI